MKNQIQEFSQLWNRILNEVKINLNDDRIFDMFLSKSEVSNISNNVLYVVVDSKLSKQILSTQYQSLINNAVEKVLETNYSVSFIAKEEVKQEIKKDNKLISLFADSHLRSDMTFDNFIVGKSNQEAYQASLFVSRDNVNKSFANPLFLYSDSGLGKTHLLNAIGNHIKESKPNKVVLYTTASEFFNEFIHLLNGQRQEEQFLDYFRNVDVLLIDDIQFFSNKNKCQELFFTIFSTLINNDKQIVVTSDRHPNELRGIENRLITRFSGGLSVNINYPDIDTSIDIIKLYIKASGLDMSRIDNDVFHFFAEKFSKSIRELKGAINKLLFYTINIKKVEKISLSNAIEAVGDFLKASENNSKLSEIKIIDVVASHYSLTPSQLTGNLRTAQIALARHIAMYLMRDMLDISFDRIGSAFGGKDHSTVMSACKNVEKGLKTNPSLQTVIKELKERLK